MPLLKKEHVVAVFFYLEKAYDTTWKHGIMKDLHKLGLKGRLPLFIQIVLSDRTFNARIGNTLSTYLNKNKVYHREAFYHLPCLALKLSILLNV